MTRSLLIGPSIAATLAWSALVALLAGLRHVNRGATVLVDPEPVVSRPKVADLLAR